MGSHWQGGPQANLGATFYPGGNDDYNMPVISPRPQRNMPEMPDQIAQNLANLELEVRSSSSMSGLQSPGPVNMGSQYGQAPPPNSFAQPSGPPVQGHRGSTPQPHYVDEPSFSPFPVLRDRKLNVPPTDEEKEDILDGAREAVLASNDPEMQLAWAQDTLAFVEIAIQNERRLSKTRPPRPRTPAVEHRLRIDAVNIVDFLAQQHHPKAEFLKGTWLEFGRFGHAVDKREAFRCYTRSAQAGYARSEYRMGMQFESSNEYEKAIQHYNLGIQQGDAASNYRMGMMKLLGQCGQRQDFAQGLDMLRYSADNADENAPQGAYVFGMLHARELPEVSVPEHYLPLNIEIARLNIEKAAYLGFAKAQVKMGAAYELCELNCPFDPALSLHYSNLAARQGEPEAEMAISKWFLSGYEGIFNKDEGMAFAYAQRAAADGLATAEFAMGYFYEVGIHVSTSIREASMWYGKAADHGNKDALGRIDGISRSKTLSRKDHEKIALTKIKSTRRRGESAGQGGQMPQPTLEMPQFPSAQDQYTQGYGSVASQSGYGQGPRPNYDSGYNNHPPVNQRPANGYQGYPQNPQPSPGPGGYPQGAGYPPMQNYNARPPSNMPPPNMAPQAVPSPYDNQYGSPLPGKPPNVNPAAYGRPGPSPVPPMQSPALSQGPGGYGPAAPQGQGFRTNSTAPPSMNPATGRKPLPSPGPGQHPGQSSTPVAGLGFTAPPDPSGADRRKNPHRYDKPNPNPPGRGGYGMPSGPASSRPPASQHPSAPSASRPPRQESLPSHPQIAAHGGLPPQSARPTPPLSTTQPTKPPASASQAPTKRPGKGPSTFEEMGVPQSKKQEDCIMM